MKIRILPLLGILFATAIFSRAFALSSDALGTTENSKPAENISHGQAQNTNAKSKSKKMEAMTDTQCVTGDVLIAVNSKLLQLGAREAEMAQKESAFQAIEARLNKQLAAVNAAKASLDASVETRTALAQADIAHLTLMYQTMKPKQAAKIFNEMDINFAAGFLRKMKGSQAGLILSNMNAKKAYQISLNLASTNAKYR